MFPQVTGGDLNEGRSKMTMVENPGAGVEDPEGKTSPGATGQAGGAAGDLVLPEEVVAACSPSLRMSMTATLRVGMAGREESRRAGCPAGLWWTGWRRGGQSVAAAASSLMAVRAEDSSTMVLPVL